MLEVFKKRRSIRQYLSKEVEEEKLNEILKAAMLAPTAHHCRSWEFIVVKDRKIIEKLSKATKWSDFVKGALAVIILCADESLDPRWIEDLSIAAGYIYLEAVNQGLGTCWIAVRDPQGSRDEENYVREIIGAPEKIRILCLMPLGYPAEKKGEHEDSEFDLKKIHSEKW
ncbi:nitroreductase family protein [Candidatus Parcubacteria bacterium]|nr:nitroreductase family protein [Candidatus Parcubacteria bacterium]